MSVKRESLFIPRILPLTLLCATVIVISADQAEARTARAEAATARSAAKTDRSAANNVALGAYLDASSGSGKFEWDSDNSKFDVDSSSGGAGFVLDSNPTGPNGFNYRLNVGIEGQDLNDKYDTTMKMGGVAVENTFGFALVRSHDIRWWAGPLVRIAFYSGKTDDSYNSYGERYKTEADLFEFGVGLATGINFRVGPHTLLAPSAGVRFIGASGTGTTKNYTLHTEYDDDLSGSMTNFFVNFSLLFD